MIIMLLAQVAAMRTGVRFQYRGEIEFISSFHNVLIEIKCEPLLGDLLSLRADLTKISEALSRDPSLMKREITYIKQLNLRISDLVQKILDMEAAEGYLAQSPINNYNRTKRGLLNFVGGAASYLFGLATQEDLERVNEGIGTIKDRDHETAQRINEQTTILHKMSFHLVQTYEVVKELQAVVAEIEHRTYEDSVFEHLLWMQGNINFIYARINSIDIGIQKMKAGKIAIEIISLNAFKHLIFKLKREGKKLLFDDPKHLLRYSDMSLVSPVPAGENLAVRFLVLLPLRDSSYRFRLHEIQTIPIWNATLQLGAQYQPDNKYLAVSDDTMVFSPINSLDECRTNGENVLCPAIFPIYTRAHPTCEIELFLNQKSVVQSCPRGVYHSQQPVFRKTSTGYLYSAPNPLNLTIQCALKQVTMKSITLLGMGEIHLQKGCKALGVGVLLMSPQQDGAIPQLVQVNVSSGEEMSLFSDEEIRQLHQGRSSVHQLISKEKSNLLDIRRLVADLKDIQEMHLQRTTTYVSAGGLIITTIVLLVAILMRKKCWGWLCMRKLFNKAHEKHEQNDLELQHIRREEGTLPSTTHRMTLRPKIKLQGQVESSVGGIL